MQLVPGIIDEVHPVGQRDHHHQEQNQKHRLQGEQRQILENPGQLEKGIGLIEHHLVIPRHNGSIQHNVHKKVHTKPGENHPGSGDPGPVQKQRKNQRAGNLNKNKGEKIYPGGEEQTAQGVGYGCCQYSHHRTKDHGSQRVDEEGNVDF